MHSLMYPQLAFRLSAALAFLISAATLMAEQPPADLPNHIQKLIDRLGAPTLAARQAAEEALVKLGIDALPALEAAQKSDSIEIRLRAAEVAARINERRIAEAEIHVIGVYESGAADGRVVVRIESAARPVVLVVCARETVQWHVQPAKGVELLKIIASGHHPQKVLGTAARVQSLSVEGDETPEARERAFYTYRNSGLLYDAMRERVKELTGKEPTTFQGRYDAEGKPFVIGPKK
ncbi:MAG TPA: hypothetical protein VFB96_24610 [Pirellulaceae bacterium]|nr:hypothetical protein [Pirellulaceae bacterium]